MRPAWCELGCVNTDDTMAIGQKLENQTVLTVEEVSWAEMADTRWKLRYPKSQVGMQVAKYAVEKVFPLMT